MKLAVIAFILLVTLSALNAHTMSTAEMELRELDSSSFGHRVLDIIQVEFNTAANPVQEAIGVLERMRDDLQAESSTLEKTRASQVEDCNAAIPQLKSETAKVKQDGLLAESDKSSKEAEIQGLDNELTDTQKVANKVTERIATVQQNRADSRKKYEDGVSDVSKMREALKRAKEILQGLDDKNAPTTLAEMAVTIDNMNFANKFVKGIHKMALAFLEVAKGDQAALKHLFSIIDKLIASLDDDEYRLSQADNSNERLFKMQMLELDAMNFQAQTALARVKGRVQTLGNEVLALKNDIKRYNDVVAGKGKELEDKQAQCDAASRAYRQRTRDITDELVVINKIISLMTQDVKPVQNYVDKDRKKTI